MDGKSSSHWLDALIESVLRQNAPKAIARAIAQSDQFAAAVERGITAAKAGGEIGPTRSKQIRESILAAINSPTGEPPASKG